MGQGRRRFEPFEKAGRHQKLKLEARRFNGERLDDSDIVGRVKLHVRDLPLLSLLVTEYESFIYEVPSNGARVSAPSENARLLRGVLLGQTGLPH